MKNKEYTELLELLNYLPEKKYKKIPKEIIEYFNTNKDNTYYFAIDPNKELQDQAIMRKTYVLYLRLYLDYIATASEKAKIEDILKLNDKRKKIAE